METGTRGDGACRTKDRRILSLFSVPNTPKQAEIELRVPKVRLRPFISKKLLKSLNPGARKGRFYILTPKARKILGLPGSRKERGKDWELIGWIMASPRQRLSVVKVLDSAKRISEDIRKRGAKYNPHMSRISTKAILRELVEKDLAETELGKRWRYYWITEKGKSLVDEMFKISMCN
jgi:predicted transcriptional regulator